MNEAQFALLMQQLKIIEQQLREILEENKYYNYKGFVREFDRGSE